MADLQPFYRGDTRVYRFTFQDTLGNPVSIVGWELWFTLKTDTELPDDQASLQLSYVIEESADTLAGIYDFVVPSTSTNQLDPGNYYYDFQRVVQATPLDVRTIVAGKVKLLADITRSTT